MTTLSAEIVSELNLNPDDAKRLQKASKDIIQKVFLLDLTFNRPGTKKQVRREEVLDPNLDKVSAQELDVARRIMDWPEYRAITAFEASTRDWVKERSCRGKNVFKNGTHPVPKANVRRVLQYLRERKPVFDDLVMELVMAFPERKLEDKHKYGRLYKENDYPTITRLNNSFGMDWGLTVIDTGSALNLIQKELSDDIFAEETERGRTRLMTFTANLEQGLAVAIQETWQYIWDKFNPEKRTATGKQQTIQAEAMQSMLEGIKELRNLNITGNPMLEEQIGKLEDLISTPVNLLKKNQALRENIFVESQVALDVLDQIIIDQPSRRISFLKKKDDE